MTDLSNGLKMVDSSRKTNGFTNGLLGLYFLDIPVHSCGSDLLSKKIRNYQTVVVLDALGRNCREYCTVIRLQLSCNCGFKTLRLLGGVDSSYKLIWIVYLG